MRLTNFSIRNFRSIESADLDFAPRRLADGTTDPEDSVVVFRGDNGVGKSNVLRAIRAWFGLQGAHVLDGGKFEAPFLSDIDFRLGSLGAIELTGTLADVPAPTDPSKRVKLQVAFAVSRREGMTPVAQVTKFELDGESNRNAEGHATWSSDKHDRARAILAMVRSHGHQHIPAFRGFRDERASERSASSSATPTESAIEHWRSTTVGSLNPADVVQRLLYDARDSTDIKERQAYRTFEAFVGRPPLSRGRLAIVRAAGLLELREERTIGGQVEEIPIQALGSGEQEVLAVLALLMLPGAALVTLEEPETHLYWKTQRRLRDVLSALVRDTVARPHQLFIETHSHEFVFGTRFFDVTMEGGKTTVREKPNSETPRHVHEPGPVRDALRHLLRTQLKADDPMYRTLAGETVTAGVLLRQLDSNDPAADEFLDRGLRAVLASMNAEAERDRGSPE